MAQEGGCQQQAAEARSGPGPARIRAAQQGHPFRIALPLRFDHHDKDAFWQGHRLRIGFPWPRSSLDYEAMTPADARDAFTRLLQTPEPELDLAEAALLIAAEEYPDLRPSVYLEQIARMGTELKRRIRAEVEPRRVVETANTYLFEELHFKGNREEYYDPRNSFLNDVIERRVGIPITLAVLYIARGERAGLPVRGVGRPGPFLVKYAPASSGDIFIDAANGRPLSRQERPNTRQTRRCATLSMR